MTGNPSDADDELPTAFLNAYEAFSGFRQDSSAATWLYVIVLNAARRSNKKARRLPVVAYAEANALAPSDVYQQMRSVGRSEDDALISQVHEACLQMFMNCLRPSAKE